MQAMQRQQVKQMWLDFAAIPRDQAERRFPTILDRCDELGLNPLERPIPVAPAAHYWMGGVATDLQAATTLPGLYAVGEVACTGVHGANRLASNSLMECLVFAHRLKADRTSAPSQRPSAAAPTQPCLPLDLNGTSSSQLMDAIEQLRQLCWRRAGVERSAARAAPGPRQRESPANNCWSSKRCSRLNLLRDDPCAPRLLEESSRRDLNLLLDLHHSLADQPSDAGGLPVPRRKPGRPLPQRCSCTAAAMAGSIPGRQRQRGIRHPRRAGLRASLIQNSRVALHSR